MEKEMTYKEFIDNILEERGRFSCGEEYHERHHILPKCKGDTDDKENLIDLFAKEHFIAHKLLAEENPEDISLVRAYQCMTIARNPKTARYIASPEEYEEARKMFSEALKELYKDKTKHPSYGKHISEERKQRISEANKGNKYCVGRKVSEETRKKISEANSNPSTETREKMSQSQKKLTRWDGAKNPKARKVVRLSDGKVYDCIKYAAEENNIPLSTFKSRLHKGKGDFVYFEDYQNKQH